MKDTSNRNNKRIDEKKGSSIHTISLFATNCYLIACNGGFMQIDCGFPNEYDRHMAELKRLAIDPSEIRYLLLTHHHDDHAGFAADLLERTGAKLIVHEKAVPWLARGVFDGKGKALNLRVKVILGTFSSFRKRVSPPVVPRVGDHILKGDDRNFLRTIGIDGDILFTTGHTGDSISVVLSNGNAFVGDAAMNFLKICAIRYHPIFIADIDDVYASWEKLKKYGAAVVYPAHGKPFAANKLVPRKKTRENNKDETR
jgi:glyoxylase-like metal-dependent hydrolase (beta-lactamase superfamily II)